jgi:hypothetical protein
MMMRRFLIFGGMTLAGWVGWFVAARFGTMTAFIVSTLFSVGGVILGWWVGRRFF